jgi:PKD repeat protein
VGLTVETEPTAQFNFTVNGSMVNFNNLSSSNSFSFEWDFGDNSTSLEIDPVHNYSQSGIYSVQLIAFNNCGSDTTFQEIEISFLDAPSAAFILNNGTGCAPLLVQFTDQSSGEVDTWQWTFPGGNPNNSNDQNPQIIYETPGTFDVTLEVTNAAGSDLTTFEDYIFVDLPIFAGFTFSTNENVVSFTNTTQNATTFEWNFGDNSPESSEENPVHTYAQPGVYLVTLVATNPLCGSAITQAVDVIYTGVQEAGNEEVIVVFPNPVTDVLSIEVLKNSNFNSLKVFHSNGQIVFQKETFEGDILEIDFSDFPSGIYFLEVLIDDKIFIEKIAKY